MKIKPLEFIDEPKNYYGLVPRTTAIVDTWGETGDRSQPRIYNRFDVFRDNYGVPYAMSSIDSGRVEVQTFDEGKALCEKWHQEYWTQLLNDIKENILESED